MPQVKLTDRPRIQAGRHTGAAERDRSSTGEARHDNELFASITPDHPLDWGHYIESRLHDFQRR